MEAERADTRQRAVGVLQQPRVVREQQNVGGRRIVDELDVAPAAQLERSFIDGAGAPNGDLQRTVPS